jgi:hypothetical protein
MRRPDTLSVITTLCLCAGLAGQAQAFRAHLFTGSAHRAAVTARQNARMANIAARQAHTAGLTTHAQLKAMHTAPAPAASDVASRGAAPAHIGGAAADGGGGAAAAPGGK